MLIVPHIISNGVNSFPRKDQLTPKHLIQWFIEALQITNVPDFTIDDVTYKIEDVAFWSDLQSNTVDVCYPLKMKFQIDRMYTTADVVEAVYDFLAEDNSMGLWKGFIRFVTDLQNKCTNTMFKILSAMISVRLLRRFLTKQYFPDSEDLKAIELLCLKSGSRLAVTMVNERHSGIITCTSVHSEYINCVDEFLDVIGENLILFSDPFHQYTANILNESTRYLHPDTETKYLRIITHVLGSGNEAACGRMYEHCIEKRKIRYIEAVTQSKTRVSATRRVLALMILKQLLTYARKMNLPFPADFDWRRPFAITFFSTNRNIQGNSLALLLMYAERTETHEPAGPYNLLEKLIQIYRRYYDDTIASDLVLTFGCYEDMVTCTKLFSLLFEHMSDKETMCIAILSIVKAAVRRLRNHAHVSYVKLVKNIFENIPKVEPYPTLLYHFINTMELTNVHDGLSQSQISKIEEYLLNALSQCDQYGTAKGLLQLLKDIEVHNSKMALLFQSMIERIISTEDDRKTVLILFLAAVDVFDMMQKINISDQRLLYTFFKNQFLSSTDAELRALYVALSVHLLVAINSRPNPVMTLLEVKQEADLYRLHLIDAMAYERSFDNMILCTAFCVLHASFRPIFPPFDVADSGLHRLVCTIFEVSYKYRPSLRYDDRAAASSDLGLVVTMWRRFYNFYMVSRNVNPYQVFWCLFKAHVHIIPSVEVFIIDILKQDNGYALFGEMMRQCIQTINDTKNILPMVKKSFDLLEQKEFNDDGFAFNLFFENIFMIRSEQRKRRRTAIMAIQKYLYRTIFNGSARLTAMAMIHYYISQSSVEQRKHLEELQRLLEKGNVPDNDGGDTTDHSESDDPDQPRDSSAANSNVTAERSNSIAFDRSRRPSRTGTAERSNSIAFDRSRRPSRTGTRNRSRSRSLPSVNESMA